ncbi:MULTISPECIES: MazG nucleotide pyrophosphohydrolase domain-containing protein [Vibrio harveyi group]|uniref:MazG nucleotide pyrophosphohydrolase domain-containing protein n=1 Tax=Vibrio harveyi group TaxID=717610 RepID=UPI001EED2124|nr:MazG nucleotide pyrophosphohydrolase domain-containing protein [Vibrio alginolyticus]
MNNISPLLELANAKVIRDQKGTWSKGSITYYEAMFEELLEVKAEVDSGRQCYLEDELGDILWVYMCMISHMEAEGKISVSRVFKRSLEKYQMRIDGIEAGKSWDDIKQTQKIRLKDEQIQLEKIAK